MNRIMAAAPRVRGRFFVMALCALKGKIVKKHTLIIGKAIFLPNFAPDFEILEHYQGRFEIRKVLNNKK